LPVENHLSAISVFEIAEFWVVGVLVVNGSHLDLTQSKFNKDKYILILFFLANIRKNAKYSA